MNKTIDTHISEVTVYDDQALVTRRGIVQLTGEEQELIIPYLPTTLVSESVQVSGGGKAGVRLLGVRSEQTQTPTSLHPKVAQLNEEIRQLEEQKRQGQESLILLNLQRNFVKDLNNYYLDSLAKSQNPEPLDIEKMGDLMNFVGEKWQTISSAIGQQEREQKQLGNQLQVLRSQLDQLSLPRTQDSFNIIITLEPLGVGELELEISYLVTQASWQPRYDLRWQSANQTVNLIYQADVKQNTGEDWLGVALILSTAKPKLGTQLPPLTPWYIDVKQPRDLSTGTKSNEQSDKSTSRNPHLTMPFAGTTVQSDMLSEAELERLRGELATGDSVNVSGIVTFVVSRRCNIPSDGASHKTIIFNEDYPCRSEYISIPRRLNYAYVKVAIANPLTSVTLLPGQANIFRDNTFIGTTQIQNIAPGQEFTIELGVDEGLKIERNLVERLIDKKLIGDRGRTTATYGYRIAITNLRNQEVEVKVIEQLPVSCHQQLKVRLVDCQPSISIGDMGILEWTLFLPPLSSQDLSYQFAIEHPPELQVAGLDI